VIDGVVEYNTNFIELIILEYIICVIKRNNNNRGGFTKRFHHLTIVVEYV